MEDDLKHAVDAQCGLWNRLFEAERRLEELRGQLADCEIVKGEWARLYEVAVARIAQQSKEIEHLRGLPRWLRGSDEA
jgi:hypothetical protein